MSTADLTAEELELIKTIILDPIINRLEKMEDTLEQMKDLYKSQMELGTYVRELKHKQELCQNGCNGQLASLDGRLKLIETRPERNRKEWQSWLAIGGSVVGIIAGLKAFGILK
jgi:hypothetical protein